MTFQFRSKAAVAVICAFIFIVTVLYHSSYSRSELHSAPSAESLGQQEIYPSSPSTATTLDDALHASKPAWTYSSTRDADDHSLSGEQCDAAFPELYKEIDRAADWQKADRKITLDDLDLAWIGDGVARILIHDRKIYVIESKWNGAGYDSSRAAAVLHAINRAIANYEGEIPNIEFSMFLLDKAEDDGDVHPLWTFTRHKDVNRKWLMADFGYWSWNIIGSYEQIRADMKYIESELAFHVKRESAVWRGATGPNHVRSVLLEKIIGKTWADVKEIGWSSRNDVAEDSMETYLTMPEHCMYKYVIHTEGASYSGRGKYLLNCHSVSIMHELEWMEPHTHLFNFEGADQNAVLVDRGWSSLEQEVLRLNAEPEGAQSIADNSAAMFRDRYLTPAAMSCYWRRMIKSWANLQDFEPTPFEFEEVQDLRTDQMRKKRKWRGTAFESYVAS